MAIVDAICYLPVYGLVGQSGWLGPQVGCSVFIMWTLTMALPRWEHCKPCYFLSVLLKVKGPVELLMEPHLTAMGHHLPYGFTHPIQANTPRL